MHHLPDGPSLPTRLRGRLPGRRALVLAVLVAGLVAALLAVAAPVGRDATSAVAGGPVSLDDTASTGPRVVMGVDGEPNPAAGPPSARAAGQASRRGAATSTPGPAAPTGATSSAAGTAVRPVPVPEDRTAAPTPSPAGTPDPLPVGPRTSSPPATTTDGTASPTPAGPPDTLPPAGPPDTLPPAGPLDTLPPDTAATAAAPPAVDPEPVDRSAGVAAALDDARDAAGCDPLTADAGLAATAVSAGTLQSHRGTPAAVVADWLADPDDRVGLLDCGVTRLGATEVAGADGPVWTAVLA